MDPLNKQFVRTFLCFLTVVFLSLAVCFTAVGLFTPSWQTVERSQKYQHHQRGLLEDCVSSSQHSEWICIFKSYGFRDSRNWMVNGQVGDAFEYYMADTEEWKQTVLVLIQIAFSVGIFALCCFCFASIYRRASLLSTVLSAIAAIFSFAGVMYFLHQAIDPSEQFILVTNETSEQKLGLSFFLAVTGSVFFVYGSILSGVYTTMAFQQWPNSEYVPFAVNARQRQYSTSETVTNARQISEFLCLSASLILRTCELYANHRPADDRRGPLSHQTLRM